jgi:nucleoside-diphosphate-sugar epimerase
MRILIIGGSGNISSAITRQLDASGAAVTLLKRSAATPDGSRNVRVLQCNRTNRAAFKVCLSGEAPFDCVVDMVGYEPDDAASDVETFSGRTGQLIFCSTVDVYSKTPASYPVTEENGILEARPSFAYGWKKVECERILWQAQAARRFPVTLIRPAFTYNESWSPGVHSLGGAQTYHLDRLRKGLPIILHGDGNSIWTATHRDDVARAFVAAIGNGKAHGQAYHLAGDEWMTQNHIWRTIAGALGAPEPDFVYIPTDLLGRLAPAEAEWCVENFQYNNIFDCAKAKRDLGFRYTVPFAAGAARCVEYLTRNGKIEDCANYPFYDRIVDTWRKHADEMERQCHVR